MRIDATRVSHALCSGVVRNRSDTATMAVLNGSSPQLMTRIVAGCVGV